MRQGRIVNLPFEPKPSSEPSKGPFQAPFNSLVIYDGDLDIDVDGTRAVVEDIDLDVSATPDPTGGSILDVGLDIGPSTVQRERPSFAAVDDPPAVDEDTLCRLEARVRIEPNGFAIRRLIAEGAFDDDPGRGTLPSCDIAAKDPRRFRAEVSHATIVMAQGKDTIPRQFTGNVKLQGPLPYAERFAAMPSTSGTLGIDIDFQYNKGDVVPEMSGTFRGDGLHLGNFHLADDLMGSVVVKKNVVRSPKISLRMGDGTVVLSDTVVEPLARGIPLRTTLDVSGLNFTTLMQDLGVSNHPHVAWNIENLRGALLSGTLLPLRIDGDITGRTTGFAVYDRAVDDDKRARMVGFREADLAAHVAIRPNALEFRSVHAELPSSSIDDGLCIIGFDNTLLVEVPKAHVDLRDLSPIGSLPLRGEAEMSVSVGGTMPNVKLEGDGQIENFVLADMPLGHVSKVHASYQGTDVDLRDGVLKKGNSTYLLPNAHLAFGGPATVAVDAIVTSQALDLRDLLSVFNMNDDPRFDGFGAEIASKATAHFALGGPEDVCGGGFVDVRAGAHFRNITGFGETFDEGDADFVYRWTDRQAGMEGADIDVLSAVLRKAVVQQGTRTVGSIIGSGTVRRGGQVAGSAVLASLPLGRMKRLGALAADLEGTVSGFARASGTLDALRIDSQIDTSPVRFRRQSFGPSHVQVTMTHAPPKAPPLGRTTCGGAIPRPFDKETYLTSTAPDGEFWISGELFGEQILIDDLTLVRAKAMAARGDIRMDRLDLQPIFAALNQTPREGVPQESVAGTKPLRGVLSGKLNIAELAENDLAHAQVRFVPSTFAIQHDELALRMRPSLAAIKVSRDGLTVPDYVFDVQTGQQPAAEVHATARVTSLSTAPKVDASVKLAPVDAAVLRDFVSSIDTVEGKLWAEVRAVGPLKAPDILGTLHLRDGTLDLKGSPSPLTQLQLDMEATSSEVRITRCTAGFSGGTLEVRRAAIPLSNFVLGAGVAEIRAHDLRLLGYDGLAATADADILAEWTPPTESTTTLPVIRGDVVVTAFEYTRPVNLVSDLEAMGAKSLGLRAQRTVVDTYDPSLDAVQFDLRVQSSAPLRIRNNLAEVQFVIDSDQLLVTGTNQRFGLRGDLRAKTGGRFRFRNSDFEIRQAFINFDDPTRVSAKVDIVATTEFRRYQDSGANRGAGGASTAASNVSAGGFWRFTLHAYGDSENLRLDMTSEPALSREDIVLLLTIGMTRAEVDQLQAGSVGAGLALEALASATGADKALKSAVPVIDDFRLGSGYSPRAGRTVPQVSVGKRISDALRAQITSGLSSDSRDVRANIEWQLGNHSSILGSYDNVNTISASPVGNLGADFRWRLEFE
jgi:translocation and assembly module TamB